MSEKIENAAKASDLGINENALQLTFNYAASEKYPSPAKKQALNGIARDAFEVLMREEHTTMEEIKLLHSRKKLGPKREGTISKAISRMEERGLPVQRMQVEDPNGDGTLYTRYFLTDAFKLSLVKEARDYYAQHGTEAQAAHFTSIPGLDEVS